MTLLTHSHNLLKLKSILIERANWSRRNVRLRWEARFAQTNICSSFFRSFDSGTGIRFACLCHDRAKRLLLSNLGNVLRVYILFSAPYLNRFKVGCAQAYILIIFADNMAGFKIIVSLTDFSWQILLYVFIQ